MEETARTPKTSTVRGHSDGHLLVDRELEALLGSAIRSAPGGSPPTQAQVQPSSLDLRLGPTAWRVRAGFLPSHAAMQTRIEELAISKIPLSGEGGAVLERGLVYLVPLEEELALPPDLRARFNPRSSTGRCDIFTRVLCERHPRFDETPLGYTGRLWLEIAPLSFPVRLARGDRLCQLRLQRGQAALTTAELIDTYRRTPLCFDGARPLALDEVRFDDQGGLELGVGLELRDPAGWRAAGHTEVVEFARERAHDPRAFWEPVHAKGGHCILAPGSFYVFASRERLRVPPTLAAEMVPVDVGIGELRNNYAGFFDNGFGWREDSTAVADKQGTPAVLEVRVHDVPFRIEDGQSFCSLRFFRTSSRPTRLYGEGSRASYRDQDLTLARCFQTA